MTLKGQKILSIIGLSLIGVASAIGSIFLMNSSSGKKYEDLSRILYPNIPDAYQSYRFNYVKINKNDAKIEKDQTALYTSVFNYLNNNNIAGDVRQVLDNEIADGDNVKIKCFTRNTLVLNTSPDSDGNYVMKDGTFAAYYSDKFLPSGGQALRYGAEAYVYISDFYADKLLKKYSLSSYDELISDQTYCMLDLNVDGERTLRVCINNILLSRKNKSYRFREVYSDYFAAINNSNVVKTFAKVSLDVDLKSNSYPINKVLHILNNYGYTINTCDFSFYIHKAYQEYYKSDEVLSAYIDAYKSESQSTATYIGFIIVCVAPSFLIILIYWKKEELLCSGLFYSALLIFIVNAIVNFYLNVYTLSIVSSLLTLFMTFIFVRKEVGDNAKKLFSFGKRKTN